METKKTKWWQKLLLALASPIVFLLLAEAVLRLFGVNTDLARNKNFQISLPVWLLADTNWVRNEYDRLQTPQGVRAEDVAWFSNLEEARYIQYKLKPRIDVPAVDPFTPVPAARSIPFRIISNKAGFRTREFSPKPKGTFRIVTLGDSSTFGWGLDPEFTWQALLEKRLGPVLGRVEVLNLGMSGFTTRHGLGVLRHYAQDLDPDLLILSFGANDARYVLRPADAVLSPDDSFLGSVRWTLLRLRSVQLLRRWIFSVYDPFKRVTAPDGQPVRGRVQSVPVETYARNLGTMIDSARSRGATAVLLSLCAPDDYTEAMRALAAQLVLPFVDGKRLFTDSVEGIKSGSVYPEEAAYERSVFGEKAIAENRWLYVTSDGCHPNRVGANIVADALAEAVEKAVSDLGKAAR